MYTFSCAGIRCFRSDCLLFYFVGWVILLQTVFEVTQPILEFSKLACFESSVQLVRCFLIRSTSLVSSRFSLFALSFRWCEVTRFRGKVQTRWVCGKSTLMMSFLSNEALLLFDFFNAFVLYINQKDFSWSFWNAASARDDLELLLIQTVTSLDSLRLNKSSLEVGNRLNVHPWLRPHRCYIYCALSLPLWRKDPRLHDCLFCLALDFTVMLFKQIKYWTTEKHTKPMEAPILAIK